MLPSRAVNNYYIIPMLFKYIVYITSGFKTCTIQVKLILVLVICIYSNVQMTPVRVYGEPYAHIFCAVDIFWNIARLQAISPVAKSHYVLRRGLMIQLEILNFFKCFSANQNQLF